MRRIADWAFYAGIAALVAAVVQPVARPEWSRWWWPLVGAGVVLVALSVLPRLGGARAALARRSTQYALSTAVTILIVLGIVGLVETLSYTHSARLDLTENRRHSLSPLTIQQLGGLSTDVHAVAFYRADQPGKRLAEDLFRQYARYAGDRFTWKVVDPDREPALARRYGVETYGTIVLETKARSEKILDAEEEKLTNALVKVTRDKKRVVYVVQGHGEHELTDTERAGFSQAKTAMEQANYEVKALALARESQVPADAGVVIVPGPRTELFTPEVEALDAYAGRGGKLLVMVDPPFPQRVRDDTIKRFLARYGMELGDNLVIEPSPIGRLFGIGPEVPIVQQYEPHPITRDLGGLTTLFPLTRTVTVAKRPPGGVTVQPLAQTSPQSWGETDRQALEQGQAERGPQDVPGPVPVAAVATKGTARIVAYGTSSLATNQFLNLQGNRDFFLNTVSWLAEEEDQISIRPKPPRQTPVFLSSQQAQAVFWLPVVILPGLVLLAGIVVTLRRRAAK